MQNAYNNYMARQKQKPVNNFKEKVKNSLSGKPTTKTQGSSAGQQIGVQPLKKNNSKPLDGVSKVVGGTPIIQTPTEAPTSQPKINPIEGQSNVPVGNQNLSQPNTLPPEAITEGGVGMMSLEDVNNAFAQSEGGEEPINSKSRSGSSYIVPGTGGMTREQYEAEVKRKQQAGQKLDQEYVNKSPQELAQELLNSQKDQAQKDWELKQQQMQEQMNQAQESFDQSKVDAENAYKQTTDKMNENRYQQMEDLNVSGTNRGIQYSPQQLGLENVANINHNKNLAEASNQRNELLNKLQIEMNNVIGQINMGMQNATNEYNKSIGNLMADYQKQMMGWEWDKSMTEEERKWQEQQAQKDKDFQQAMQDAQNKWQSGENALDRKDRGRSSGGGRGYSGGGYSRNYSAYNGGTYSADGWGGYDDNVNFSDETDSLAYEKTVKEASTDSYNAVNQNNSPYSAQSRMSVYGSQLDDSIAYAKNNGANESTMDNFLNMRDFVAKNLWENHATPLNYGGNRKKMGDDKTKYTKDNINNKVDRKNANLAEDVMKRMERKAKENKNEPKKENNKPTKNKNKSKKSTSGDKKKKEKKHGRDESKSVKVGKKNSKKENKKSNKNSSKKSSKKNNEKTSFKDKVKNNVSKFFGGGKKRNNKEHGRRR